MHVIRHEAVRQKVEPFGVAGTQHLRQRRLHALVGREKARAPVGAESQGITLESEIRHAR
jgi:hypothetical protein